MNKKNTELEVKLNNSKIIPDDVYRGMSATSFFSSHQKKQDDLKLFADEFTKVKI